jgi:hypothetical protein
MSTGLVRKFSALAQVLQHFQAVHSREPEVQDHHLGADPVESGEAGLAAQLPGDLIAEPLEVIPDAAQHVDIVIDEENGSGHAGASRGCCVKRDG